VCKPPALANIDPECCHICAMDGWGGNCFCWGNICCAPKAVKDWSHIMSSGVGGQNVNNYAP